MNNDYHLTKVKEKIRDTTGLIEVAEMGRNFYSSDSIEVSLVKIEEHLDKVEEEAKKMIKISY